MWNDWTNPNEVTMTYECLGELPDGSIFQVQNTIRCANEKDANEKIDEWNRLAKITKGIKYSYRRLS